MAILQRWAKWYFSKFCIIQIQGKKKTGKTPGGGNTKYVKIAAQLKYLSNFWRTLEMAFN